MFKNITLGKIVIFLLVLISCIDVYIVRTTLNGGLTKNEKLYCYIGTDYKLIDKNKIITYEESTGYWVFTNGYAKNCYIDNEDN